jgi:hypothetical protein
LCTLVVLTPSVAAAQAVTGTILGRVTDSSGAVIPGATVTLTNTGTTQSRAVVTDAAGEYSAPSLPTGKYTVTAEIQGFKTVTMSNVDLGVDQHVRIDIKLEVGALTESVTIEARSPLVQTSSSELGTTVNEEQIKTLPLNGRNFVSLTRTVPGVVRGIPGANIDGAGSLAWPPRLRSRPTACGRATTTTSWTASTTTRRGSRPSCCFRASTRSTSSSCRPAPTPRSSGGLSAAS